MSFDLRRILFWAVPLALLAAGLAYAFWPTPVEADLATVARGPLVVTVEEEGETRIKDIFVLSAPVAGRVLRIEIDAGDPVVASRDLIAEIEPSDPSFLDRRSAAEAAADVDRAKANLAFAEADLDRLEAELAYAETELRRIRELSRRQTVSQRTLDEAERAYKTGRAAVAAAAATVQARQSELTAAEARTLTPVAAGTDGNDCACLEIRAPVTGRILRLLRESAGVVEAGAPLVEIGDPADLEIVADFLSSDAVRIEQGQRVIIDRWGGDRPLKGLVDRVEPLGFTKVSALGIEEQRVNVVIALADPPAQWARLGHGFQVEAQVVLWEDSDVLKTPLTALFREGEDWAVFAVVDGRATIRKVEIGHRTDLEAEVLSGLSEGDVILRYPNDAIAPGRKIVGRGADGGASA